MRYIVLEEWVAGMVLSSKESETARPAGAVAAPKSERKRREWLGEEKDPCIATHRSLEGLGYLGMLPASPTDMGVDCFRCAMGCSEKTLCRVPMFASLAPIP